MNSQPFTVGRFTWDEGKLKLAMVGTFIGGKPSPRNPMERLEHAYRWGSPQAAGQFLRRHQGKSLAGAGWRVIDLRRLGAEEKK